MQKYYDYYFQALGLLGKKNNFSTCYPLAIGPVIHIRTHADICCIHNLQSSLLLSRLTVVRRAAKKLQSARPIKRHAAIWQAISNKTISLCTDLLNHKIT